MEGVQFLIAIILLYQRLTDKPNKCVVHNSIAYNSKVQANTHCSTQDH